MKRNRYIRKEWLIVLPCAVVLILIFGLWLAYVTDGPRAQTQENSAADYPPVLALGSDSLCRLSVGSGDQVVTGNSGKDEARLAGYIRDLHTSDFTKLEDVKRKIVLDVGQSEALRSFTIGELVRQINTLKTYDDVFLSTQENHNFWQACVELLGDLKAVETLPCLMARLEWGVRMSDSLSGFAAYRAAIKIGAPAVPFFGHTLLNGSKRARRFSAQGLAVIGGEEAEKALESSLLTEEDDENRRFIALMIEGVQKLNSEAGPNTRTLNDPRNEEAPPPPPDFPVRPRRSPPTRP